MSSIYTDHYDGNVQLEFFPDLHIYLLNDKQVYGVTDVLNVINKPQLNDWKMRKAMEFVKEYIVGYEWTNEKALDETLKEATKASDKVSDDAADDGKRIHKILEDYIKAQIAQEDFNPTDLIEAEEIGLESFLKWQTKYTVEWLGSEQKVYSAEHGYAGTFDGLANIDGKRTIVDFKCVKKLYDTYLLQGSAYAKASEEETGEPVEQIYILKIPKTKNIRLPRVGEMKEESKENIDKLFNIFVSCLNIRKWMDGKDI